MKSEVNTMPPKGSGNKELKQLVVEATEGFTKDTKTYKSQRVASANYEKNKIEQITVRLPKGSRQVLQDYVDNSDKFKSVNAMIKALLEAEIGQTLD